MPVRRPIRRGKVRQKPSIAKEQVLQPDYQAGVSYWAQTPASLSGVMGGYGDSTQLPRVDALGSRTLLLTLLPALSSLSGPHATLPQRTRRMRALDCGAGIGRVTNRVLLPLFDSVDLVEPLEHFVEQAVHDCPAWYGMHPSSPSPPLAKRVRFFQCGLQTFDPAKPDLATLAAALTGTGSVLEEEEEPGYDVVWIQWCIGHLSDTDFIAFLQRSKAALRPNGMIMVKENLAPADESLFDADDSSITRSDQNFLTCFAQAGLSIIRQDIQHEGQQI
ncbi:uncharacterized protein L969DRAFT_97092 [Mixia osmundae IAM 14324]|uniref:Alpha N-terminal protein methyltransferase 1 n=1 Tax=Mixia osmundae (strain CBS 9802 / IAM 14324 / JCM 22182 / KY 12970) TaxID=764103 RepID=G7E1N3_MIXOS|nr:uncharacterized protein L969DRAFT_97092 [Mixia osmundae IAM 14324]KEI36693.1 hypothetical protein L969DRAFT_97092 [Mixia osmundae IAM 14324]GAA96743.1 hypothetical protein E5Q_03414 [Mixia osmundae IAM 14324]